MEGSKAMKHVFLYARVSTEEQAVHGLSIEAQVAALEEWAKANGHRVVGVYIDAGISARKPATKRPELQRLLLDAQAGKGELIVFTKLDRWFRNIAEYYKVQEVLEKCHVDWRTIQEDYDTSTASGRLKINIMLSVAQDEADRTSERIKAVFKSKRAKNEPTSGRIPKGYKIEGKKVVLDEPRAKMVRAAFDTYFETGSISKVIKSFPELKLNYYSARYMFASPSYAGDMGGVEIPPIISHEEHMKALALHGSVVRKTKENRIYLFSGLVFCPECGRRMGARPIYRKKTNGGAYYICPGHHQFKGCSNSKHYSEKLIEQYLLDHIDGKIKMMEQFQQKSPGSSKPKRDAIKRKLSRLSELYVESIISKEDYTRQYRDLNAELDALPPEISNIDIEAIKKKFFPSWKDVYADLSREGKQAFWRNSVKGIYLSTDCVRDFDLT